jgi:intermediate filament protein if
MQTAETLYSVRQTEQTSGDSSLRVSQVVKGEMSAKTTYQRSAKGPVSISECAADGRFITIENTGRKNEDLSGWQIERNIDGMKRDNFTFNEGFSIRGNGKIKIWAGAKGAGAGRDDITCNFQTWGIGANITTKLVTPDLEDKATHTQKTVYTSA